MTVSETIIKVIGRNTQGEKLIKLDANDKVADVARVVSEEENDEELEVLISMTLADARQRDEACDED